MCSMYLAKRFLQPLPMNIKYATRLFFGKEMFVEKKRKIAKILSLVVMIAGLCVMIGWILDIGVLKSIRPTWVSMKFDTAIAFVLSGITLYFIVRAVEGEFDKAQAVLSVTSLVIILLMGVLFSSAFLKVQTGLEDLFIKEPTGAVNTAVPGRPSIPTMFSFMLIGIAGIIIMLNPDKYRLKLKIIGSIVAATGVLPIVGYSLDFPILYYYIEGMNSAIACHTAALFVLLGTGLLCL
jgi:hypothetical protein